LKCNGNKEKYAIKQEAQLKTDSDELVRIDKLENL